MLIECLNCGFYVASNEKTCPDCGLNEPNAILDYKSDDDSDSPSTVKSALVIASVASIVYLIYRYSQSNLNFSELTWMIIGAILLLSLFFALFILPFITRHYSKIEKQRRFATADAPTNFQFIQDTLLLKNHELKAKLNLFETASKKGSSRRAAFGKSRAPLEKIQLLNLSARFDLLSSRVEFARLENQLRAISESGTVVLNDDERVEWLGGIADDLELVSLALTDDSAGHVSETILDERKNLLTQVVEAENYCRALSKKRAELAPFQKDSEAQLISDYRNRLKNANARETLSALAAPLESAERRFAQLKIVRQ